MNNLGKRLDWDMEIKAVEKRVDALEMYKAFQAKGHEDILWADGKIGLCMGLIEGLRLRISAERKEAQEQGFKGCSICAQKFAVSRGHVWASGGRVICYKCMGEDKKARVEDKGC